MCYEAFVNGDAEDKTVDQILREELSPAVKDGVIAAAVVLVMLVAGGTPPGLVALTTVVTFALGILLHQAVLVAGIGLLRMRSSMTVDSPEPA